MAKLGYVRMPPGSQALEKQIQFLEQYGCDKIYTDSQSGKNAEREGLKAMFEYARGGDVVIVHNLSRLATSIQDLRQIINELKKRDIDVISVTEDIDTSAESGEMFFRMVDMFAEFERELTSERIRTGIHNAKEKGVQLGRKEANKDMKEKAYEMYVSNMHTMKEIVEATGLSRATIYRYINQNKSPDN